MSSSIELGLGVSPVLPAGEPGTPWEPSALGLRAWYDAELGQPKGVGYVQLDGTSGDYIYTPDRPDIRIAGDLEVVMRVKANVWTAAANQTLAGRYVTTGNQRSWRFYVSSAGAVVLTASADGTAVTSATITPTVALVDGVWVWLRMRLQLSNGANSVATLETAADQAEEPTSWTANGSQTAAIIAGVFAGTAPLEIGTFAQGTLERFSGQVSRCIVRDGFGGPSVADFDARQCYGPGYTTGLPTGGVGSSKYVQLYGRSSDYIYCADAAPLDITGDIEIVVRVALPNWAPGATRYVAGKDGSASDRSWLFAVSATGELIFYTSTDGTAGTQVARTTAGVTLGAAPGAALWLKVTLDVDNGAGNNVTRFYWCADQLEEPTSGQWTQLGTDRVAAGTTSIFSGARQLELGAWAASSVLSVCRVFRAIVRNGIGGTVVADYNAQLAAAPAGQLDAYGNEWRHNNSKLQQWIVGLPKIYDRSGNNVAPATFGAGSNMPQWEPWTGVDSVYLPGPAGNYVRGTYTGGGASAIASWDAAVKVELDALGGSTNYLAGAGSTHFTFLLGATNLLRIRLLDVGLSLQIGDINSAAIPGLQAGVPVWLRGKVTVASALCEYWYSYDETNDPNAVRWIPISSGIGTNAGASPLLGETDNAIFGAYSSGLAGAAGRFYAGKQIQNDGTADRVFTWQASQLGQRSGTPTTGATLEVIRATSGRKPVVQSAIAGSARSVILHGTDDLWNVPHAAFPSLDAGHAITQVAREHATPVSSGGLFHKRNAGGDTEGVYFRNNLSTYGIQVIWRSAVPAEVLSEAAAAAGARFVASGVRSGSTGTAYVNANVGSGVALSGTYEHSSPAAVGTTAFTYQDMEADALLTLSRALTAGEHAQLVAYYRGGI